MLLSSLIRKVIMLWHLLLYRLNSRHKNGHGIHSPFAFDLISKVIFDRNIYREYNLIEKIRTELMESKDYIETEEAGAGSVYFRKKIRKISEITRISSVNSKYGRLLFRMVRYYKPETIVEFGTSLGLSTIYMAAGNSSSTIYTIEKSKNSSSFAQSLFNHYNFKNINLLTKDFNEILTSNADNLQIPSFVFIDGDHHYNTTIKYFEFYINRIQEGILIFDDIQWSSEMRKAWKKIAADPRSNVTIDLFFMGIVIKRAGITSKNYCVRF